jgi:hypothetical protein
MDGNLQMITIVLPNPDKSGSIKLPPSMEGALRSCERVQLLELYMSDIKLPQDTKSPAKLGIDSRLYIKINALQASVLCPSGQGYSFDLPVLLSTDGTCTTDTKRLSQYKRAALMGGCFPHAFMISIHCENGTSLDLGMGKISIVLGLT